MNSSSFLHLRPLKILCVSRLPPWSEAMRRSSYQPFTKFVRDLPKSTRPRSGITKSRGFGKEIAVSKSNKGKQEQESQNKQEDEIPKEVFNRMIGRILFSVGIPMVTGIGSLYIMGILKEQKIWDVPLWLPFLTILLGFGSSALGIAYGTLSTSWDPEKDGSLLGWEQVQKNWPELWKEENES